MMEFYYKQQLPQYIVDQLEDEDDGLIVAQDSVSFDTKEAITKLVAAGNLCLFHLNGVSIFVRRKTAWVGHFDTKVSKQATAKDVIKAYKEFFVLAKEKTMYNKLETRTPLEKFAKVMARAAGAELEGVRKASYKTKEGVMVDEYLVGYVVQRENV